MNAVIDSPERSLLADSSAIKVTVIYEDFLSGARAKHFAERLDGRPRVHVSAFRFHVANRLSDD